MSKCIVFLYVFSFEVGDPMKLAVALDKIGQFPDFPRQLLKLD